MDDLISRAYVLAEYDRQHKGPPGGARKIMEDAPAVDAVPVVMCCKCKHWKCFGDAEDGDYDIGTCELYDQGFGAECFCSNGERKEDE